MNPGLCYRVRPGGVVEGELRVPGDKSISHRAVMLSAIADGDSRISGMLEGADVIATMNAFAQMGVSIDRTAPGCVLVRGVGIAGLKPPAADPAKQEPVYPFMGDD